MRKFIPLLLCCLLLNGCFFRAAPLESTPSEPPVTEAVATQPSAAEPTVTEPPATQPPVTEPPVTEPAATEAAVTAIIYYGNENADGFETAEVSVAEINPSILVQELSAHGVLKENVSILSIEIEGSCL